MSQDGVCMSMSVCGSVERRRVVGVQDTTALLWAIISTVSLIHVAQLTDFTGPIKGPMENSGPVYTSQGKHGSAYQVSSCFSVVELGFHLYSQSHKNHNGIVCKIKNRQLCGGFVVFFTTKSLKSYYK